MKHLVFAALLAAAAPIALASGEPQSGAAEASPPGAALGHASELLLPPFQQTALAKDSPAADLLFTGPGSLMILGTTSLWQWRVEERTLKRLMLREPRDDSGKSPLSRLATDGISYFAASDEALFQVQWDQGRVFRYLIKDDAEGAAGGTLGFAGFGDDFWLLHVSGLSKFDRYGRSLLPRFHTPFLRPTDKALLDPKAKLLWFLRKNRLYRVDLAETGGKPEAVLTAKHPLLDLQRAGTELVTHTAHTVLRLDADGKLKHSIPVEGRRKLLLMALSTEAHAYLFDDQLLEVFRLKDKSVQRFRLPLDDAEAPATLRLAGSLVALTVDGRPRVFHLSLAEAAAKR